MGRLAELIGGLEGGAAIDRAKLRVGALMVGRVGQAFDQQGSQTRGGEAWPARGVPNLAGALSDLAQGATIKARRFDTRPALVDTGELRASVSWRATGDGIEFGSQLDRASAMQRGEPSEIPVTPTIKQNLADWLRANRKHPHAGKMAALLARDVFTARPRARAFVEFLDSDRESVAAILVEEASR